MTAPARNLLPLAPAVGPFADPDFLFVVHRHHGRGELLDLSADDARLVLELVDDVAVGLGHRDLIDYRSPLGAGTGELLADLALRHRVVVDSLPLATAETLAEAVRALGATASVVEDDATAVLDLPASSEAWLAGLDKKERHETRRKRRRYEAEVGPVRLDVETAPGRRFDEFVALHRRSSGPKGTFMTEPMAAYFADLLGIDGWAVHALVAPTGGMVAAGFGATDGDAHYLYNSAFDPDLREASPGVVLVGALIEATIEAGLERFDFLKGDEPYKGRLGAIPRPLATLEVTR